MIIMDIRQSQEWSEYLSMYGWVSHTLSKDVVFRTSTIGPICFGKLHRPQYVNDEIIDEVKSIIARYKMALVKISPLPGCTMDIFKRRSYKTTNSIDLPPSTLMLNLSLPEDTIWGDLSSGCRKSCRKSLRDGDRIEIIRNPGSKEVEEYYHILASRGSRKGFFVQSLTDHKRKVEIYKDKAFILNVFSSDGHQLGTKMFLGSGDTIYYMHGALTNLGQNSQSGYRAIWEAIKHFKTLGYKTFDFECLADSRLKKLTKSWQNYSDFKLKFGGEVIEYPLPYSRYYGLLSILN